MTATSTCIGGLGLLFVAVASFYADKFQFEPATLHLREACNIFLVIIRRFGRVVEGAHPSHLTRGTRWEYVVGALGTPPHEIEFIAIGVFPALFMAIVKVRLPRQRHLLTEKSRAEFKRTYEEGR